MRNQTATLVCLVVLAGLAPGVEAHHSFAAVYDETRPVRVEGTVERVEWRNPHVTVHVATVGDDGARVTWSFEMGSPRVLTERLGWSVDSVRVGDRIAIDGFLAREGDHQAAAQTITTADGARRTSVLPFR